MLIDKRKDIHQNEQTERQKEGKLDHCTDRPTYRQADRQTQQNQTHGQAHRQKNTIPTHGQTELQTDKYIQADTQIITDAQTQKGTKTNR
jgi:hypothetical protein